MTLGILKKWITDTLRDSLEYQTICINTIGSTLNFYRSAPMNEIVETLPFLTVFSDDYEEDLSQDYIETFVIPLAFGISANMNSVDDGSVTVWSSTDNAEIIAREAQLILKKEANGCGINGEDIRVLRTNMAISEIGEADDVQASMFITFGKLNTI